MFVVFNIRSLLGARQFSECVYANCTELKVGCKLPHRGGKNSRIISGDRKSVIHFVFYF